LGTRLAASIFSGGIPDFFTSPVLRIRIRASFTALHGSDRWWIVIPFGFTASGPNEIVRPALNVLMAFGS
jgi:hypothetical protein